MPKVKIVGCSPTLLVNMSAMERLPGLFVEYGRLSRGEAERRAIDIREGGQDAVEMEDAAGAAALAEALHRTGLLVEIE